MPDNSLVFLTQSSKDGDEDEIIFFNRQLLENSLKGLIVKFIPAEKKMPAGKSLSRYIIDVIVLFLALSFASYLIIKRRSRAAILVFSILCLLYFGFYREGCVCSIGAIQNVSQGIFDPGFTLPILVLIIFLLPLIFALFFGRVFCGAVCPLGIIQDIMLLKAVRLPKLLDHSLGMIRYIYLGAAVLFAALGSRYIICEYDPFVGLFRFSGPPVMLLTGGLLLLIAIFINRPYCRWLCPYGALLGLFSKVSRNPATITPGKCIICSLCENACPVNANTEPGGGCVK